MSPFDCYVLGYIASLTTCSWDINITCYSTSTSTVAMLVKGTVDAKHENFYPAEALPVSLRLFGRLIVILIFQTFSKHIPHF